ncbi:putative outer membrane starch-binding protein [Flavobacterium chryseum]|uniref:RagB/SusD family nutrient uptake outer membrane protein n=1 Tax=Flavobacterium sp. P3160 TaxID=2512113 RepID=UPI00105D5AD1|nr:RagB/SusD family nutrient uptake outer membrane protein [Flavobacterium sp. P3160]TDO83266.1 putative outer membrane starch-binding protein [Flavobacterium sp. P3160]
MKNIYIAMSVFSALIFAGCSDDYLDVKPSQSIPVEDLELYNNDIGAKSFVTSVYNEFLSWEMSSFAWNGISSIASDDADKGSIPGDTGADKDILDALTYEGSNPSVETIFKANYVGINRANQAIVIVPKLDKANSDLRSRLVGEAKFLRAFMYFTLVKCYGGVPLIDHIPVPGVESDRIMQLTRKTPAEIYAFIEQDLNEAAAALPEKSAYSDADKARASKGAAYALLAKVSLYQKKWQQVVDNCNKVTGYSIVGDYASMYKVTGEFGPESIFEINSVGTAPALGIDNYSVSQGIRSNGGWGWGFNAPSQSLINAYEPGDVRKAATIIFPGSTLYDGRIVPSLTQEEITAGFPKAANYKAYSSNFTDQGKADANIRYLRYAEVLLMKAEAFNELGQTGDAIPLLNQIRNRANLGVTPAVSQADVRIAIWKERRVELAFEHDRFFDLVRTGQAKAAFAIDGKTFTEGKNEVFPLPASFLREASGLSQQNPLYVN